MRDQVINGTWVRAAEGWPDDRTVGIYVNLRNADCLIARRDEKHRSYRLCAVFGMGPDREPRGLTVPLELPTRHTERDALKSLDELARVVGPAAGQK